MSRMQTDVMVMLTDMLDSHNMSDMTVSLFTADSARKSNVSSDFDYMVQAQRINDTVKFEIHKFLAGCDNLTPFDIDYFINHLYMKGFEFSEMDLKDYLSNAMIANFMNQL